jgi:hypothetical protein
MPEDHEYGLVGVYTIEVSTGPLLRLQLMHSDEIATSSAISSHVLPYRDKRDKRRNGIFATQLHRIERAAPRRSAQEYYHPPGTSTLAVVPC